MDWLSLQASMMAFRDRDFPARTFRNHCLTAVLENKHYDHIAVPFNQEISGNGEYIPLHSRRPSVTSGLCRIVVDDSVSLLFSEGHFPALRAPDAATVDALTSLVKERRLNELMCDAATRGSVGSVAILLRVLKAKPFFSVLPTAYLTPEWDAMDPGTLVSVTERYKVAGADLFAQGYPVAPDAGMHWFMRKWDTDAETWFMPWPVYDKSPVFAVDATRTVRHGLGFVPMVWVLNLPGGNEVDGCCTFEAGIGNTIEIDYAKSQAGRALKYASDPKLVIRDPEGTDRKMYGGAANALVLSDPASEAKFLEINGTASAAVEAYADSLRSMALEAMHGMRADPDKLSTATSGRALEMLHQGLIWLADRLRTSYGEGGFLSMMRLVCRASQVVPGGLLIAGVRHKSLDEGSLSLVWPRWFSSTAEDRQSDATTAKLLVEAGVLSRETALRNVAGDYDVENVMAEVAIVAAETIAADKRANGLGAQVKALEVMPS